MKYKINPYDSYFDTFIPFLSNFDVTSGENEFHVP